MLRIYQVGSVAPAFPISQAHRQSMELSLRIAALTFPSGQVCYSVAAFFTDGVNNVRVSAGERGINGYAFVCRTAHALYDALRKKDDANSSRVGHVILPSNMWPDAQGKYQLDPGLLPAMPTFRWNALCLATT